MNPPLFAVLAAALALPASAGTSGRVEVVPEALPRLPAGVSGAGVTPLTITPMSLASVLPASGGLTLPSAVSAASPVPLLPAALAAKSVAPSAKLVLPKAKPFQPAAKSAATEGERKTLIQSLAAPQIDASKLGALESASALEADFMARAQLGESRSAASELPGTLGPGVLSAAPVRLKKGEARAANAAVQASALKSSGAREVLAAYESGALAQSHPDLAVSLEKAGHDAMRAAVSKAKFKERFLYGGVFGTYIYESEDLPGVILKVYRGPLDLLGLPSSASRGYALAKEKLGGLFAETTVLKDATVTIEGKKRSFARVLVQELTETKSVKDWGKRAQATHEAMIRRGVRDTDTGPRAGFYDAHLARNLGETKDGRVVHFDADWFKAEKEAFEPGRRVPDPEPLRSHARAAQEALLAELRAGSSAAVPAVAAPATAELAWWGRALRYLRGEANPAADEIEMKENLVPAWAREELTIVAAKLGKSLDAEGTEKVLARTNLWPYRWHSRWSYEVDGLPDGHHDPKFGIRLMLRTSWRRLMDPRSHFTVLFAHEYAHWLQNEKLLTYAYGIEIPAVAVEQLRAVELVGLEGIKAGKIGFMGQGSLANFESGRAWARGPMTEEMSLYHRGVLGGVAYEVGVIAGRPEAAWEFLRLVARETDRLSPRAAFKVVAGLDK